MKSNAKVVKVLGEHIQMSRNGNCICGWRCDVERAVRERSDIYTQHREHLADMLASAGVLK